MQALALAVAIAVTVALSGGAKAVPPFDEPASSFKEAELFKCWDATERAFRQSHPEAADTKFGETIISRRYQTMLGEQIITAIRRSLQTAFEKGDEASIVRIARYMLRERTPYRTKESATMSDLNEDILECTLLVGASLQKALDEATINRNRTGR